MSRGYNPLPRYRNVSRLLARKDGAMRVLLLDYDTVAEAGLVSRRLPLVIWQTGIRVKAVAYMYSSSGKGLHVIVYLRDWLPAFQVVVLQAILGSDWKRETFNLVRVRNLRRTRAFWRQRWNVLYSWKFRGPE